MKCTTCQQTNFSSIHGRIFCADCGVSAANRLQQFKKQTPTSSPDKVGSSNLLDLSKSSLNKTEQSTVDTRSVTTQPSVSGLSGPLSPQPVDLRAAPPTQQKGWQVVGSESRHKSTANYQGAESSANREEVNQSKPGVPASAKPITHMQPHQTYSVKDAELKTLSDLDLSDSEPTASQKTGFFSRLSTSRLWRTGALSLSVILLAGYVTYLNYPGIAVRVAASRANIEAQLPGYLPNGYSFSGPVSYNPGRLTISFRGSGREGITLTQSTTRWDSLSLLENHVKLRSSTYETYRENGLTIYTYDGKHAAWVNSGMLYEIESNAALVPDEIIMMASSL